MSQVQTVKISDLPSISPSLLDGSSAVIPLSQGGTTYKTTLGAILNGGGTLQIITGSGAVTVLATDSLIILNKAAPSATTVNLPSVISRHGLPLQIIDWAGNGGDITLTPHASDKIMGLSSGAVVSNAQGLGTAGVIVLYPSTDLNGWYTV